MVVADSWGEQRVLMRAYADSPDQTRPTIVLHGTELAIGPAGVDPHGEWGIHVEPPVDGRAQELRAQLELAARRLAGTKGHPPRLQDELSSFEKKRTNHWAPGTPPDLPRSRSEAATLYGRYEAAAMAPAMPQMPSYYEPAEIAPPSPGASVAGSSASRSAAARASMPTQAVIPSEDTPAAGCPPPPAEASQPPAPAAGAGARAPMTSPTPPAGFPVVTPLPTPSRGWTSPVPNARAREVGAKTAPGFAEAPRTGVPASPPGRRVPRTREGRLASTVGHTMPLGFRLTREERAVLNALGETDNLTARKVAEIAGVPDGVAWMEQLMSKLSEHGLDLVVPGDDLAGEPTYCIRR